MEEKNPKIIASLSKIEKNTGKLISMMVKGTGTVVGTQGRAAKAAFPSVVGPVKIKALKTDPTSKQGKALMASTVTRKPAIPPTLPNPAEISWRG